MNLDITSKKYLLTLLMCFLSTLLGFAVIYPGLALNFLHFSAFFIFFIFFPTHFFAKKFIPFKISRLESFVYGYIICEVFLFSIQWIFNFFGFKYGIWSFLIFALLGIKSFLQNKQLTAEPRVNNSLELKLTYFFMAHVTLFFALYFLIEVPSLAPGRVTAVYQDQLWNLGNTWSIVRGKFPTIDSRFANQILGYHLIQSYMHATFTIVSGIHALLIQNYYFALVDAFMIIFTFGLAARRFLRWNDKTIVTTLFMFMFTKGIGWYYQGHLYSNPLTFYHSITSFFLFLFVLLAYLREKKTNYFPLLLFSFCVMTGSKPILTILFLSTLFTIFTYKLILKKDSATHLKNEFLFGLGLLVICGALMFMIFLNSRPLLINEGGDYSTFFTMLTGLLPKLSFGVRNTIFLTYLIFKRAINYVLNPQGVILLMSMLFIGFKGKLRQNLNEQTIFLIISICFCVIYENVIRYDGSDAEIYFSWYGLIIVIFIFGLFHTQIEEELMPSRKYQITYYTTIVIGFLLFLNTTFKNTPWKTWLAAESRENIQATVTYDEFQSLDWLNKNAKDSDIILSHRRSFPKSKDQPNGRIVDRFFAYSALSGKQFFVEGDSFNCCDDLVRSKANWVNVNQFINSTNIDEKVKQLKIFNVNYFIQSLRFNKVDFSNVPTLEKVYSNPDINIYKVKNN